MSSIKQAPLSRTKKLERRLTKLYQQKTWRIRALPDFIIIGAQKAGTGSLYYYLKQHPQILSSFVKEVHYFDGGSTPGVDNFEKGQAWYRAYFPLKMNVGANRKTFEASPRYIFYPPAPERIYNLVPEVKLIALLRNPTERAISHYLLESRRNRETLPIWEAMHAEEKRLEPVITRKDYKHDNFNYFSYKSRGLYKEQLERYFNYFPRNQILVLSSEEFFMKPDKILERVFEFVGVDKKFKIKDLKPRNVASNRTEFAQDIYDYLNNYFLPHNQSLCELLNENFGW